MSDAKFIYILGPTAVGKSDLALALAQDLSYPIINCDSVQVYQKTDIGTAKPSLEERQTCPHFLFDYVSPGRKLNAADYLEDVLATIKNEKIENALFVGGSGFYVQALEKGLYPESKVSESVKSEVAQWIAEAGFEELYQWITEKDPEFAQKISGNDHYRVRRAVEVMKSQNLSVSELKKQMAQSQKSPLPSHKALKVALRADKEVLRKRVEARTQKMLAMGLIDEVRGLMQDGFSLWQPMQSVGYKEVQMHLNAELSLEELVERIVISTMQLIKKQMTWFKRDKDIEWFDLSESEKARARVIEWSKSH